MHPVNDENLAIDSLHALFVATAARHRITAVYVVSTQTKARTSPRMTLQPDENGVRTPRADSRRLFLQGVAYLLVCHTHVVNRW